MDAKRERTARLARALRGVGSRAHIPILSDSDHERSGSDNDDGDRDRGADDRGADDRGADGRQRTRKSESRGRAQKTSVQPEPAETAADRSRRQRHLRTAPVRRGNAKLAAALTSERRSDLRMYTGSVWRNFLDRLPPSRKGKAGDWTRAYDAGQMRVVADVDDLTSPWRGMSSAVPRADDKGRLQLHAAAAASAAASAAAAAAASGSPGTAERIEPNAAGKLELARKRRQIMERTMDVGRRAQQQQQQQLGNASPVLLVQGTRKTKGGAAGGAAGGRAVHGRYIAADRHVAGAAGELRVSITHAGVAQNGGSRPSTRGGASAVGTGSEFGGDTSMIGMIGGTRGTRRGSRSARGGPGGSIFDSIISGGDNASSIYANDDDSLGTSHSGGAVDPGGADTTTEPERANRKISRGKSSDNNNNNNNNDGNNNNNNTENTENDTTENNNESNPENINESNDKASTQLKPTGGKRRSRSRRRTGSRASRVTTFEEAMASVEKGGLVVANLRELPRRSVTDSIRSWVDNCLKTCRVPDGVEVRYGASWIETSLDSPMLGPINRESTDDGTLLGNGSPHSEAA
jgi:hypothetical protein